MFKLTDMDIHPKYYSSNKLQKNNYSFWHKHYINKIITNPDLQLNDYIIDHLKNIVDICKFKYNNKCELFELIAKTENKQFKFKMLCNAFEFEILSHNNYNYLDDDIHDSINFGYDIWKLDNNHGFIDMLNSIKWQKLNLLLNIDSFEYFMDFIKNISINNSLSNLHEFNINHFIQNNIILNIKCKIKTINVTEFINFKHMVEMSNFFTVMLNNSHTEIYNILVKLKNGAIIHVSIVNDNYMTHDVCKIDVKIKEYNNIVEFIKSKNKCIYNKILYGEIIIPVIK